MLLGVPDMDGAMEERILYVLYAPRKSQQMYYL